MLARSSPGLRIKPVSQNTLGGVSDHRLVISVTRMTSKSMTSSRIGFAINMNTQTSWSAVVNFDSSSFVAEKELIEALEKRASTLICTETRCLFMQGGVPAGLYLLR